MVNRILISPSTFKVSKQIPGSNNGYDVNTATADQLAFDANSGYSYAGIIFSGTENFSSISSDYINGWTPITQNYTLNTTHRWKKDITFASKGISRTFSAAPGVIFMVKKSTWSNYATPTYSYVQRAGTVWQESCERVKDQPVNWDGKGTRTDSPPTVPGGTTIVNKSSSDGTWVGGAIWASCSIDSSGYGTLTIRMDKNDFATSMPEDWTISYIVFQNFTGLPTLTPV